MSSNWQFSWSSGPQALQELASDWQCLADRLPDAQYYQRPQWFESYLKICENPGHMLWLTARADGELCAVLPLQRLFRRVGPLAVSELRMVSNGHMTLADVCADRKSSELWMAWWQWLQSASAPTWDRLAVTSTPADGVWAAWMQQMLPSHALHSTASSSARTDCRRSLDDLLKACSANHRSNLSRRAKRAEAIGPLRYEYARTPEELRRVFPVFLEIESSGWKGAAQSAVASNPAILSFYETLLSGFGPRGECEIDILHVGDRPVASVLWFRTAREMHLQKIGYLEEMSDLSPGKLLMRESFRRACADPSIDRLCFITHPDWADPWKPESNPVLNYSLFRNGVKGQLLWRLIKARRSVNKQTQGSSPAEPRSPPWGRLFSWLRRTRTTT
jgi:CelD/BcsL family acetyltransferase involved in cellulose biosynthesis